MPIIVHVIQQRECVSHKRLIMRDAYGGGHGAVVKAACLESRRSRVRAQLWPSSFKENKCFLPTNS